MNTTIIFWFKLKRNNEVFSFTVREVLNHLGTIHLESDINIKLLEINASKTHYVWTGILFNSRFNYKAMGTTARTTSYRGDTGLM